MVRQTIGLFEMDGAKCFGAMTFTLPASVGKVEEQTSPASSNVVICQFD
jgi:hypothetical protein